jgi:hypothetical protein
MRFATVCSIVLLAALFFTTGCGAPPSPATGEWKPIAEVPAELMAAAQKELPQVKFESARKITVYGKERTEIRGKAPNGKVREVEVTPEGKVVEVE